MKKVRVFVTSGILFLFLFSYSVVFAEEAGIVFADPKLEEVIREQIDKPEGPIDQEDVEGIYNLTVVLDKDTSISSLEGIESLSNLQNLSLEHLQINDLRPLESLTKLESLRLNNNQISDLSPLKGLKNLQSLSIGKNHIQDLTPIGELTNLTFLEISYNDIVDLTPIAKLINLQALGLAYNKIQDVHALSGFTKLEQLSITDNAIKKIDSLKNCINLTTLYANDNQIEDISPVSDLRELQWLELENNQISDISPLGQLTQLEVLYLRDNQITNIHPLAQLNTLEKVYLARNQLFEEEIDNKKEPIQIVINGKLFFDFEQWPKLEGEQMFLPSKDIFGALGVNSKEQLLKDAPIQDIDQSQLVLVDDLAKSIDAEVRWSEYDGFVSINTIETIRGFIGRVMNHYYVDASAIFVFTDDMEIKILALKDDDIQLNEDFIGQRVQCRTVFRDDMVQGVLDLNFIDAEENTGFDTVEAEGTVELFDTSIRNDYFIGALESSNGEVSQCIFSPYSFGTDKPLLALGGQRIGVKGYRYPNQDFIYVTEVVELNPTNAQSIYLIELGEQLDNTDEEVRYQVVSAERADQPWSKNYIDTGAHSEVSFQKNMMKQGFPVTDLSNKTIGVFAYGKEDHNDSRVFIVPTAILGYYTPQALKAMEQSPNIGVSLGKITKVKREEQNYIIYEVEPIQGRAREYQFNKDTLKNDYPMESLEGKKVFSMGKYIGEGFNTLEIQSWMLME